MAPTPPGGDKTVLAGTQGPSRAFWPDELDLDPRILWVSVVAGVVLSGNVGQAPTAGANVGKCRTRTYIGPQTRRVWWPVG